MQDERARTLVEVLAKVLGVALAIGLVIGGGLFLVVKALGVDGGSPSATVASPEAGGTPADLPTVALSQPGSSGTVDPPSYTPPKKKRSGIKLAASPSRVGASQRINLTGQYPGGDNVSLQVQRKEGGRWAPFADVQAQVRVGTFATYVMTSRPGPNVFRVVDPRTRKASNAVTVRVG